jgi:hypothetical protein
MANYRLSIDNVLSNLSLFTEHDVGGEGHSIIVEEEHLPDAIAEIVENFSELIASSFEEEEDEEEGDEE